MADFSFDRVKRAVNIRLHTLRTNLRIAAYNTKAAIYARSGYHERLEDNQPPSDFETRYADQTRDVEVREGDMDISHAIITCYFTSRPDPHFGTVLTDPDIRYIAPWYDSITRLKLYGVIIYDSLPQDFIDRYQTEYVRFRRFLPGRYSIFEERWFAYYMFVARTKLSYAFFTDANDVYITADPFGYASVPDMLYIGRDVADRILDSGWILHELAQYEQDSGYRAPDTFRYQKMYNAGVIGGSREVLLFVISKIIALTLRTETPVHKDMTLVNLVVHLYFRPRLEYAGILPAQELTDPAHDGSSSAEHITSGYPLNSAFRKEEIQSKAFFIHK